MSDKRPNIVFVLADNVGWGDWSCYGGNQPTPRIDQLADEGIRFTNHCVENECTPTRTAIMTGRQSVRCGTYTAMPIHGSRIGVGFCHRSQAAMTMPAAAARMRNPSAPLAKYSALE